MDSSDFINDLKSMCTCSSITYKVDNGSDIVVIRFCKEYCISISDPLSLRFDRFELHGFDKDILILYFNGVGIALLDVHTLHRVDECPRKRCRWRTFLKSLL